MLSHSPRRHGLILDHLGVYTVGLGFILDDENIHAPDEIFRLTSFQRAQKAYCLILKQLAALAPE